MLQPSQINRTFFAISSISWAILFAVLSGGGISDGSLFAHGLVSIGVSLAGCWALLSRASRREEDFLALSFWDAYQEEPLAWARVRRHFENFRFLLPRNKLIFYTLTAFSLWGVAAIYVLKASVGDMGHLANLWVYGCIILTCCGTSFVTEYSRQTSYLKLKRAGPFDQQFAQGSVFMAVSSVCLLLLIDDALRPEGLLLVPALGAVLFANTAFQVLGSAFGQMINGAKDEMLVILEPPSEEDTVP